MRVSAFSPLDRTPSLRDPAAFAEGVRKREERALDGLTPEQRDMVRALGARDREVRAHEAAHQAAGGGLAGAASFTLQTGPDGRSYAIGGEVPISIRSGRTPAETIRNAQQARAAALAPADPSSADYAVAALASQIEQRASEQARHQAGAPAAPEKGRALRAERAYRASTEGAAPAPSSSPRSDRADHQPKAVAVKNMISE